MSKSKSNQPAKPTGAAPKSQGSSAKAAPKTPAKRPINLGLIAAAMVAVAAIAAIALLPRGGSASLPKEISVTQAKEKYDSGAFMLDVRQPEEWDEYHVSGATLIPLGELESRLSELPKDKPIVVVCRSGNRSQQGRDILLNAGFGAVTSMAGGLKEWSTAGYPTVNGP